MIFWIPLIGSSFPTLAVSYCDVLKFDILKGSNVVAFCLVVHTVVKF